MARIHLLPLTPLPLIAGKSGSAIPPLHSKDDRDPIPVFNGQLLSARPRIPPSKPELIPSRYNRERQFLYVQTVPGFRGRFSQKLHNRSEQFRAPNICGETAETQYASR